MNYFIHLTNNAVQENCPKFSSFVKGNIISLQILENFAREQKPDLPKGYFMSQMIEHVKLVFEATFDILNPNNRRHCFELFGFDFMIDADFKVWLIEVNSGPSLSETNPFLSRLLHRMMGTLRFDQITSCRSQWTKCSLLPWKSLQATVFHWKATMTKTIYGSLALMFQDVAAEVT